MRRFRAQAFCNYLSLADLPYVETRFLPYDDEVRRTGAARHFLTAIGMSESEIGTLGPERRVNESIGPVAVAAARDTLARIRSALGEPTERQRAALRKTLFKLIENEAPEPPFQGVDDALQEEIEAQGVADRERFAQAAWGRSWYDVFPPARRKPCNAFNGAEADAETLERYERMTAALWSAAQAIMADKKLSQVGSWDI